MFENNHTKFYKQNLEKKFNLKKKENLKKRKKKFKKLKLNNSNEGLSFFLNIINKK